MGASDALAMASMSHDRMSFSIMVTFDTPPANSSVLRRAASFLSGSTARTYLVRYAKGRVRAPNPAPISRIVSC
jgi:hypothetical protein